MTEKYGPTSTTHFQPQVMLAAENLTVQQAADKYPDDWEESMHKELRQFHDMQVGRVITHTVDDLRHKKIIKVNGFYKEVFDLQTKTHTLAKLKFRLVPQGHRVDKTVYRPEERTSPTVSMESIFASINIAAFEKRKGFTMDIPGAYLNAHLKDPHMASFPKPLADIYCSLYPEYEDKRQEDGSLLLLIEKAFYGFVESGHLWYETFKSFLLQLGYGVHPSDQGVFIKETSKGEKLTICLWVDDILGFSTSDSLIKELRDAVCDKYGDARYKNSATLSFLGMTITQPSRGGSHAKQQAYATKIVQASGVTKTASCPTHRQLVTGKPSTPAPKTDPKRFLSLMMSAMFLGKRTRPEILTSLSYLGSRITDPDEYDMVCLLRIFEYLKGTLDRGLYFHPESMQLYYWCDAAYGTHTADMKGHTGMMATLGYMNAPILAKSNKQKLNTRSSTEAELVALDDTVLNLLWLIQIITFMGYPQEPVIVFQDNQSTMTVCNAGHSKSGKLKHMAIRWHFINSKINENVVKLVYCPTAKMVADVLTKPLTGPLWDTLSDQLLNRNQPYPQGLQI
jgi:hypothetical protein